MLTLIRIEIAHIISAKTVYELYRFSAQYNMEKKLIALISLSIISIDESHGT